MKKEKNMQFIIFYIVLALFSLIYLVQRSISHGMKFTVVFGLIVLIVEIISFFLLKHFLPQKKPLEKIYLPIAIILGLLYLFAFPLSQLPDEVPDYLRSLEVANFHLTSEQKKKKVGREFSTNIKKVFSSERYSDIWETKGLKLNEKTDFYSFANKSLYAFVCYIPQALGVGIGSLLGFSIVVQSMLGKILNYALFVLLVYFSIKHIPSKKMLLFFIALLPMTLQEAMSLSPDAMTIGTSIALISMILYFRNGENRKLETKDFVILSALVVALSLCKIVYLPLCFLIFLIPKECFKSSKQKYVFCCIISLIVIILNLTWLKISSGYLDAFSERSNSTEQLQYILSNPIRYILIIFATIDSFTFSYLDQLVGHSLGKFNVTTSSVICVISLGILAYLIFKVAKKKDYIFEVKEKIFILLMALGTIGLMFTSLYMQWTAVASPTIDGIQGRYFIPLLPVFAMLFLTKKEEKEEKEDYIISYSVIANLMALVAIFVTFIG